MKITKLIVGSMGTNCYIVSDPPTSDTYIIDPGDEADFITSTILENRLKPLGILLTHGHFDHCLGVLELKLNFSIPIHLHTKDIFLYNQAHSSAHHFAGAYIPKLPPIDIALSDKQLLPLGSFNIQVLHTPGHTPGSVCFFHKGSALFTGDTIFSDEVGRTDLSYSSPPDLNKSLSAISKLPSSLIFYPGHGETCPNYLHTRPQQLADKINRQ